MSALLGADTRRLDLFAERLSGHSRDIQSLRIVADRVLVELRNAWDGRDLERLAQRWEQGAGPRLDNVSSALLTMATALRAQADEQRRTSGNAGGSRVPAAGEGMLGPLGSRGASIDVGGDGVASADGSPAIGALDPAEIADWHLAGPQRSATVDLVGAGVPESSTADKVKENVRLNIAHGEASAGTSLASLTGGGESARFELSAGTAEASADYSAGVDAQGNLVASAGASAGAFLGYAAGRIHGGNDFANGTVGAKAYAGAEAKADASGSIGRDGAKGHVGAEAFAGAKAEVNASGTVAGVTASAGAEISYGIGAHGDLAADLSMTNVGVSLDIGATLGIGAGVSFDVSVNPQEVLADLGHAVDGLGDAGEDAGKALASVGEQIAGFVPW